MVKFKQKSHSKKLSGFTLAELLLVTLIVGIISTMVIPAIVVNVQKRITAGKLKKIFSSLDEAAYMAMSRYGAVERWKIISGKNRKASKQFAETYLIPYMHISRVCDDNTTKDCKFNDRYLLNGKKYATDTTKNDKAFRFYTTDGTLFSMVAYYNNSTTGHNKLVTVAFDVNGQDKPNIVGRDVFIIEYMVETFKYPEISGMMIPQYGNKPRSDLIKNKSNMCNKNQSGEACLALIYKDGWHITKDYPW